MMVVRQNVSPKSIELVIFLKCLVSILESENCQGFQVQDEQMTADIRENALILRLNKIKARNMTLNRYSTMQKWWHYCRWLIALALPLIWWSLPGDIASALFMPVWVVVGQLIFAGLIEAARLRRRAWLGQYLETVSPWHRLVQGGVIMVIWYQLLAFALALILVVSLRQLAATDWPLLWVASGLFIAFERWLRSRLNGHVIAEYLPAVTRQLSVLPVAGLLTILLALAALWRPQPYLVGVPWEVSLRDNLVVGAGQTLLGALERIASGLEISGFWVIQNALDSLDVSSSIAVLGWGVLLLMQGTLAWSFVRLMAGMAVLQHYFCVYTNQKQTPCKKRKRALRAHEPENRCT